MYADTEIVNGHSDAHRANGMKQGKRCRFYQCVFCDFDFQQPGVQPAALQSTRDGVAGKSPRENCTGETFTDTRIPGRSLEKSAGLADKRVPESTRRSVQSDRFPRPAG